MRTDKNQTQPDTDAQAGAWERAQERLGRAFGAFVANPGADEFNELAKAMFIYQQTDKE